MIGKQLAQYKIVGELGRGGMGIVYKAEDTRLHRTVALKLLPVAALGNPDDRARFFREAQAAAQLHHANIATVFAIEEAAPGDEESRPFIAMEFIEGETLTERIASGPMKLKEVVDVSVQIALALEAAHEKNIVHRDVKSGNVMLTKKGDVKVLDFGLAKTNQSTKLTQLGSTLGTIAYMSPEQARGEDVDRRSDIWSLGVLMYEMIAGRLPFASEYEQAAVYSILNEEPEPLTSVRTGVPMGLEWIVSKLLAKRAENRYQNISDLLVDLRTVDLKASGMSRISKPLVPEAAAPVSDAAAARQRNIAGYFAAAGLGAAVVIFAWMLWPSSKPPPMDGPPLRFTAMLTSALQPSVLDISDDGSKVAYYDDLVHVLDLSTGETIDFPGTESSTVMEFSGDGNSLLLTKTTSIDRLPIRGGTPTEIVRTTEGGPRANWGPDDWIVFEDRQNVFRYSESRDELFQISSVDTTIAEEDVDWPSVLPGGNVVMGTQEYSDGRPPQVRFWDIESGDILATVNFAGYRVQYLPTGHLAGVVQNEGLVVVPFDIDRLAITGPRISVLADVAPDRVSISPGGTLVYLDDISPDQIRSVPTLLQFPQFRRRLNLEPGFYRDVEVSPDGSKLAFLKWDKVADGTTIWVMDLDSDELTQVTTLNVNRAGAVTWMPGSDSLAYVRLVPPGKHSIYVRAADGSGQERLMRQGRGEMGEIDVSPDGSVLAYVAVAGPNVSILRVFDVRSGQERVIAGADGSSLISNPKISSDGHLIAYKENETVFIHPLDDSRVPFNVSRGFAEFPRWSRDGAYYWHVTLGGSLFRFEVDSELPTFVVPSNRVEVAIVGDIIPYFDVFPDNQSAIVPDIVDETASADSESAQTIPLHFVLNWFAELRDQ